MRPGFPGGPVFEAVPDPLGAPGYAPEAGGEPEPVVEPEPFQISQEDWERTQQGQQYLIDRLEQIARMGEQQQQDPNTITLPEDSLLNESDLQVIGELIQRATAPFAETREQWMQSEGQGLALDVIADENAQNGEFLFEGSKQRAQDLSENYYPDYRARYGHGPDAAEAALRQACADIREWEQQVGKAYMEREQNQLATLAGAPRSPSQPGRPAAQQLTTVEGGNEFDVLRKWFPDKTF